MPRVFHRWWFWALSSVIALFALLMILAAAVVPLSSDTFRHSLIDTLSERLDSDVELGDLHMRVFPTLHAEGSKLVIRRHGRTDVPPLISVARFTVDASFMALARRRVTHLQLTGLDIQIPPDHGGLNNKNDKSDKEAPDRVDEESLERTVVIDTVESRDARLIIVPRKEHKQPKIWAIHTLKMHGLGFARAMPFEATLTNGVPPGEIETSGSFGPWQTEDPGLTPLNGMFDFAHADLSVFEGIAGNLSSRGSFGGTLDTIDVNGETDTPDFTINVGGHPFPLHTKYHAIVDGTNGDTRLENIDATFLSSHLVAKGAVLDGPPGSRGRTVTLDVNMDRARVEDVMKMAVKAPKPPMTGGLRLTTKFLLPPGKTDVSERLRLEGRFGIARVKFTDYDVQGKINELSRRARAGRTIGTSDGVVSDFQGRFKLGDGRLSLPDLSFAVPGAKVMLAGSYALKPETLDFKGQLLMDAKVSQTVGGIKGLLLKVVDPLFKQKDGSGSAIPIKIVGTRKAPDFGLDMRRVFRKEN